MVNDYYDGAKKKVIDFFIGFGGSWLLGALFIILDFLIHKSFNVGSDWLEWTMILFLIIINALAVYFGIKKQRRFISIGIIATSLAPLLFFGACMGLLVATF